MNTGYSNNKAMRITGAILLLVSLLFLLLPFIGTSFVAVSGVESATENSVVLSGRVPSVGVSPAWMFIKSFQLSSILRDPSAAAELASVGVSVGSITAGVIVFDVLFVAVIALAILTAVMALVDHRFFSPLWVGITAGVYALLWIVTALVANSKIQPLTMGIISLHILPTLWLFLFLGCTVAPIFLIRKGESYGGNYGGGYAGGYNGGATVVGGGETVGGDYGGGDYGGTARVDDNPGERTMPSSRSNLQGVQVRVQYTDNSGSHIVKRQILTDSPLTIGRSDQCKLVLNDSRASGVHAKLTYDDLNGLVIEDNGSTNGVQVNGETIMKHRRISKDDTVRLGDSKLNFTVTGSLDEFDGERTIAAGERYHEPVRVKLTFVDDSGNRVETVILKEVAMIGRLRECEVPVDSTTVSQKHARLLNRGNGRVAIEDNASTNGVKVNGEKITAATPIGTGDVITLGSVNLRVTVGR